METRVRGSKPNFFRHSALMGLKLLGRRLTAEYREDGYSIDAASRLAVMRISDILPDWKDLFERLNGVPLTQVHNRSESGESWFAKRIDHHTEKLRQSQKVMEEVVAGITGERSYTLEEWMELMKPGAIQRQDWWLYILPFDEGVVHKVGISTDCSSRLIYYHMCYKREQTEGDKRRHTYGHKPSNSFSFRYNLGPMYRVQAESIEKQCQAACCKITPSLHGQEWFCLDGTTTLRVVCSTLQILGIRK